MQTKNSKFQNITVCVDTLETMCGMGFPIWKSLGRAKALQSIAPLEVESLEATLKSVSFDMNHLKLWSSKGPGTCK